MPSALRVGLFGVGLEAYWPQFPGLRERLEGYLCRVKEHVSRLPVSCVSAGLVDTPERAAWAGHFFRQQEVDLILIHSTTYALSSTVLPVVRRVRAPVVLLNLAPAEAIDYAAFNALPDRRTMTGEWLAHCAGCAVPEFANVLKRAGLPFQQVTGTLNPGDACWPELDGWIAAAGAAAAMSESRMGLMGHYYGGMLDIYTDLTLQSAVFGTHFEMLEVDELSALRREVTEDQARERAATFRTVFDVQSDCAETELMHAARTSVALGRLVAAHALDSLAYYYKGTGVADNEATLASIILGASLLTARGIPVAGEYEVKNAQAMKILCLLGAGGSFTEVYAMDFAADVVLMGHDGPGDLAISEGKAKVRPLEAYHGKVGSGLSIEMSVRHGPVTLLSVIERTDGKLALLCAEGESVPGPILEIGNTNSRYRFACGARQFVSRWNEHGPAHHCAVGAGHVAGALRKFGVLAGLEVSQVA